MCVLALRLLMFGIQSKSIIGLNIKLSPLFGQYQAGKQILQHVFQPS